MIKVCDAIMGTGKSQSAIAYMNAHPEKKFIYIAPYEEEAHRIALACPDLNFVEPLDRIPKFQYTKTGHTRFLVAHGKNVASTHQCFKFYTADMLLTIREQGYTLIVDENVDTIDRFVYHPDDLILAMRAGLIEEKENGEYEVNEHKYTGKALASMLRLFKSRDLFMHKTPEGKEAVYFWSLPTDILDAFEDVYILTYMFEGQALHQYLTMNNRDYKNIGVVRTEDGKWEFSEDSCYIPEYVGRLSQMIHICDHAKLNSIGDAPCALSMNWFKTKPDLVKQLARNLSNYFRNILGEYSAEVRMWGTFKDGVKALRGKGYYRSDLIFNTRATNDYRNKKALAYAVNLYMNVDTKNFLLHHGAKVNEDLHALSIMLQWIWRSAIRDGEEIYIYIPSRRMRELLIKWIADVEEQYRQYVAGLEKEVA